MATFHGPTYTQSLSGHAKGPSLPFEAKQQKWPNNRLNATSDSAQNATRSGKPWKGGSVWAILRRV